MSDAFLEDMTEEEMKEHLNWLKEEADKQINKTKCGKPVHYVGMGVCGQRIVQVKIKPGSKLNHKIWKLCRVVRKTAVEFGSGTKYKLEVEK